MANNNDDNKQPTNKQKSTPSNGKDQQSTPNANDSDALESNESVKPGFLIKHSGIDTVSTGTCGSLFYSYSETTSSSLWTYEDLVIKNDSEVYIDMTKDIAHSIIEHIETSSPNQLLTNHQGNILANIALWVSKNLKGTTNMEPLENKENIIELVNSIKLSIGSRLKHTHSQVHFSEQSLKIHDSDSDLKNLNIPDLPKEEPKKKALKEGKPQLKNDNKPELQQNGVNAAGSIWDKLFNAVNRLVGYKNHDADKDDKVDDHKNTFINPVAGTSKDPVPLSDLGKRRTNTKMITISPRPNREHEFTSTDSELEKNGQLPRPKPPRALKKSSSKSSTNIKDFNSKVNEVKMNDSKPQFDPKHQQSLDLRVDPKHRKASDSKVDPQHRKTSDSKVDPQHRKSSDSKVDPQHRKSSDSKVDQKQRKSSDSTVDQKHRKSSDSKVDPQHRKSSDSKVDQKQRKSSDSTVDQKKRKSSDSKVEQKQRQSSDSKVDQKQRKSSDSTVDQKQRKPSDSTVDPKHRRSLDSKFSQKNELSLDSNVNLAIARSRKEAELKQNRRCIGLSHLVQNKTFEDASNLKELIDLLAGVKATKDWARDGKYLFHYPEDLRTFGTLLALVVGGCVLNGILKPTHETKYGMVKGKSNVKMDKIVENELISGYLRAIEGFHDGIRAFSPRMRRY